MVADVPADPNSGVAGTEFQTLLALRQLGHEVDALWADAMPRRIAHPNLHYLLELPRSFVRVIESACRRKDYDVIHCNQPHAYLAAKRHRRLGRPGVFVNRSHGFETHAAQVLSQWRTRWAMPERVFPKNLPGWVIDAGMRRHCHQVLRFADGVIVSCTLDREYILNKGGISPERVAVIPQAVPSLYQERTVACLTPERLNQLLVIGPPRFWKGPDVLGPAVSTLMARDPAVCLTWVCASTERAVAAGFITASERGRVRFQDPLPQERLIDLYDRHGILLFPSLFEGFGKVFLEAMARGLCVVASNTGGMRDLISPGRDGLLVPVGDTDALGKGIQWLLDHPGLAANMGVQARQTAQAYSWDRVGRETVDFYQHLAYLRQENSGV